MFDLFQKPLSFVRFCQGTDEIDVLT